MNARIPFALLLLAMLVGACAPATGRFDILFEQGRGPASDGRYKVTRHEVGAQGSMAFAESQFSPMNRLRKITVGGSYHRQQSDGLSPSIYQVKLGLHGDPTRDR